jgi:PilZ domain
MAIRTYLGDRRTGRRFRINGEFWASVDVRLDVRLHNITTSGALLEARLSEGARSIRTGSISLPGGLALTVRVRHVTPVTDPLVDDLHLLGVEFVKMTSADRQAIAALVQACRPVSRSS